MAVSGSFDFTLDRDSISTRALQMIGAVGSGQTPTAAELSDAADVLNLMLKSWQADGMQLWKIETQSLTPVASQSNYTWGPSGDINTLWRPEAVLEVYRRETATSTDVPLLRASRQDFTNLSDKATEGTPTVFYFNPQDGGAGVRLAEFNLWITPDTNFATDYTIEINYQKPFDDMDSATDSLSFPQYWELAVVLGLASLLSPEYGLGIRDQQMLEARADKAYARALSWDRDNDGSVFFQPAPWSGSEWGN